MRIFLFEIQSFPTCPLQHPATSIFCLCFYPEFILHNLAWRSILLLYCFNYFSVTRYASIIEISRCWSRVVSKDTFLKILNINCCLTKHFIHCCFDISNEGHYSNFSFLVDWPNVFTLNSDNNDLHGIHLALMRLSSKWVSFCPLKETVCIFFILT